MHAADVAPARGRSIGGVLALATVAWLGLAPAAAACPTCGADGQGVPTLTAIMGFLVIPYVIVSCVMVTMKHVIASEDEA
ncbi:MAG: hypothetical protein H6825_02570 [Planctomycetes bacterium]|nr:hypothetical protein [Planctomycetota bacterium]